MACEEALLAWLSCCSLLGFRTCSPVKRHVEGDGGARHVIKSVVRARGRLRPDNPYLLLDEGGATGLAADADLTTEVRGHSTTAASLVLGVREVQITWAL